MRVTFRPIGHFPPEFSRTRNFSDPFRAGYGDTIDLLGRELDKLGADSVVIVAGFRESDIRLDGLPRGDARQHRAGTA